MFLTCFRINRKKLSILFLFCIKFIQIRTLINKRGYSKLQQSFVRFSFHLSSSTQLYVTYQKYFHLKCLSGRIFLLPTTFTYLQCRPIKRLIGEHITYNFAPINLTSKGYLCNFKILIDKIIDKPLVYYFHPSRQEQNDQIRFDVLFASCPKS